MKHLNFICSEDLQVTKYHILYVFHEYRRHSCIICSLYGMIRYRSWRSYVDTGLERKCRQLPRQQHEPALAMWFEQSEFEYDLHLHIMTSLLPILLPSSKATLYIALLWLSGKMLWLFSSRCLHSCRLACFHSPAMGSSNGWWDGLSKLNRLVSPTQSDALVQIRTHNNGSSNDVSHCYCQLIVQHPADGRFSSVKQAEIHKEHYNDKISIIYGHLRADLLFATECSNAHTTKSIAGNQRLTKNIWSASIKYEMCNRYLQNLPAPSCEADPSHTAMHTSVL